MKKKAKAKMLKDVCLHCVFFKTHQDKWPDWCADGDNIDGVAFNDLMHSAIKIVAELFDMLDEEDQMKFFHNVMVAKAAQHIGTKPTAEVLEAVKQALMKQTKH